MTLKIDLDVFGEKEILREYLRVGRHAADLRPALWQIADDLREHQARQFESAGRYGGVRAWPDLLPSTIERKERDRRPTVRKNAHRVLFATERLWDSLTSNRHRDHIERIEGRTTLEFGTRVPYARFHQRGTRKMRARPILVFTKRQRREVVRTIQRWMMTGALR